MNEKAFAPPPRSATSTQLSKAAITRNINGAVNLKPKSARTHGFQSGHFFVSYPAISHSSLTHAHTHTHTQAKLLLPVDLHYELAALTKLFQKPAMRVRLMLASSSSSLSPEQQVSLSVNGKWLVGRSVNGVRLVGRSVVGRWVGRCCAVLCDGAAVELRWG